MRLLDRKSAHYAESTPPTGTVQAAGIEAAAAREQATGLYVHVPFCFHKCHYCDFYSIVEDSNDRQGPLVGRLIAELKHRTDQYCIRPRTVFIGGGTPTLLGDDHWDYLLREMAGLNLIDDVQEWTVEANPETVRKPLLDLLVAGGVNRLSIGCQSFDRDLLAQLERWHDPYHVARAVQIARQAGIQNISLDLIFAISGQSLDQVQADLDHALDLRPDHLSYYGLTYEANTPLTHRRDVGQIVQVDEELERQMYELILRQLDDAGFEHYEISNWARRDHQRDWRCQHNINYWKNHNWLGVGPSAASHINGRRWKNQPHLGRYLAQGPEPPTCEHECLSPRQRQGEHLMLALRLREGIELGWVQREFPRNDRRHRVIGEFVDLGMLERTDTHLRLTLQGLFVADSIISRLLE